MLSMDQPSARATPFSHTLASASSLEQVPHGALAERVLVFLAACFGAIYRGNWLGNLILCEIRASHSTSD
jgi:hypothetical protein